MNKSEFIKHLKSLLIIMNTNYSIAIKNKSTEDRFFWRGSTSQLEILIDQIERGDFDD